MGWRTPASALASRQARGAQQSAQGDHDGEERRSGLMLVHQGFRFELDPPNATRSALSSHCGASRYAFNWGLRLVNDQLEATRKLTVLAIRQGADLEEAITWARKLTGPLPDRKSTRLNSSH